ncbi:MAG: hypothetical protein H6R10_1862 [Rhodocyclaceae bacterium]|nr:hypothetical protein [Rhodocyclaceae bacterium]
MKKFLSLLAAVAFASTALFAQAATPRAAEDPNDAVVASDTPVPKVRKAAPAKPQQAKAKPAKKKTAHKPHGKKHGKAAKGKKKARPPRH